MSVALIRRMLDTIPNVVAIKSEEGYPLPPGIIEMYHHFRVEVVISHPIESQCISPSTVARCAQSCVADPGRHLGSLRASLPAAGLPVTDAPDAEFMTSTIG